MHSYFLLDCHNNFHLFFLIPPSFLYPVSSIIIKYQDRLSTWARSHWRCFSSALIIKVLFKNIVSDHLPPPWQKNDSYRRGVTDRLPADFSLPSPPIWGSNFSMCYSISLWQSFKSLRCVASFFLLVMLIKEIFLKGWINNLRSLRISEIEEETQTQTKHPKSFQESELLETKRAKKAFQSQIQTSWKSNWVKLGFMCNLGHLFKFFWIILRQFP